ncbi:MAG: hypothetical protein POH28_07010 [Acidocella sp.]|nr:hypothetical protein [Acidocella sp.]
MNHLMPQGMAPPLHDLLGVSFVFNTQINVLGWDKGFACFGLQDGSVAIMRANWDGAPVLTNRPGGGVEIIAATAPPPPPAIFPVHKTAVTCLANDPLCGVLTGGADGAFCRMNDGEIKIIDGRRKSINAVAAGRGGRRACATGRHVDILGPDARRLTMPKAVTGLCYDPAGLHLAVGYGDGVSMEACAVRDAPRAPMLGACTMLAWRHDGGMLAAASHQGSLVIRARDEPAWRHVDIPISATAIAFEIMGNLLIGGEAFLLVWRNGDLFEISGNDMRGPVACHPRLPVIACADKQGRIVLRAVDDQSAIQVREPGTAPILLSFSPDGQALAFATLDGEAGTVMLPDLLFRRTERA